MSQHHKGARERSPRGDGSFPHHTNNIRGITPEAIPLSTVTVLNRAAIKKSAAPELGHSPTAFGCTFRWKSSGLVGSAVCSGGES